MTHATRNDAARTRYEIARHPWALISLSNAAEDELRRIAWGDLRNLLGGADLAIRREHARQACGHWTYDLNRHIALKRARDRIRAEITRRESGPGIA